MKLRGSAAEYKSRHDAIWPELRRELAAAGVVDYSIFLDEEAMTLFAVHKVRDGGTNGDLSNNRVVRKWWDYMADLMDTHPDRSPVCTPLTEVFHME